MASVKTLTFITGNKGKFSEVAYLLTNESISVKQKDIDLVEIQSMKPREVIEHKLKEAVAHYKENFIVEDTSLFLHGMGGFPGPFIKFMLQTNSLEKIAHLVNLTGNKGALAVCVIGYLSLQDDNTYKIEYFEAKLPGRIVEPRGDNGFGWDAIFQPEGSDKTFAEMTNEEKSEISMRKMALLQLKEYLDLES